MIVLSVYFSNFLHYEIGYMVLQNQLYGYMVFLTIETEQVTSYLLDTIYLFFISLIFLSVLFPHVSNIGFKIEFVIWIF